jgi:hypothetical protein
MYSAPPGIAEEVARVTATVTAYSPADLAAQPQPPDGKVHLAPDYAPVAVAVARLKYKNYSDSQVSSTQPTTTTSLLQL